MRFMLSEKNAQRTAVLLQRICYLIALLAIISIVLVLLGRMELNLTTPEGHYEHVLLLEKDHNATSRFLSVSLSGQDLFLNTEGSVGFITWMLIALIGIVKVFPIGFSFFLLAKFFKNISEAKVFITHNANILLNSGVVLIIASLATPILNGSVFPFLINHLTPNRLTISAPLELTEMFYGAIFLVMAYVFHYGIHLQDEADHTL